jgi:hypothetical protein
MQVDINSTLPTTISSITVLGAKNTRRSFLRGIFNPLLSANNEAPYTLAEALKAVSEEADKLNRFGMPVSIHQRLSLTEQPSSTPQSPSTLTVPTPPTLQSPPPILPYFFLSESDHGLSHPPAHGQAAMTVPCTSIFYCETCSVAQSR